MSLMIPAPLLPRVREGVYALAGDVAEAIDHGEDLRDCSQRLSRICDLLDTIGWSAADEPDTDVDGSEHTDTLAPAVALMVGVMRTAVNERDDADPAKGAAEEELRLMRKLAERIEAGTPGSAVLVVAEAASRGAKGPRTSEAGVAVVVGVGPGVRFRVTFRVGSRTLVLAL